MAYASEPAAPTAAYVAEKMDLPGSPYESVEILCNKDKFRAFLKRHGFCTPGAKGYWDIKEALSDIQNGLFRYPIIVKPVDSSGSKGVYRIDSFELAESLLKYAMTYSRGHRIIVEEFVEKYVDAQKVYAALTEQADIILSRSMRCCTHRVRITLWMILSIL